MRYTFFVVFLLLCITRSHAQQPIALADAVARMDTTHPELKVADQRIQQQQDLRPAAVNLPNPQILFQSPTGTEMRPSILWTTEFPTVYAKQRQVQDQQVVLSETERKLKLHELRYELTGWYFEIQYLDRLLQLMQKQDSAYARVVDLNKVRATTGDLNALEKMQAETQFALYHTQLLQTQSRRKIALTLFNRMIGAPNDSAFTSAPGFNPIAAPVADTLSVANNPATSYYGQQLSLADQQVKLEKNRALPGLMLGYFNQGPDNSTTAYYRLNFGVTVPLFFWQYSARIKASKEQVSIAQSEIEANAFNLQLEYAKARQLLAESQAMLSYYAQSGAGQSGELLRNAEEGFRAGAIGQLEYLRFVEQANALDRGNIDSIFNYNKAVLYIQFLNGFAG
jgi:outer membrane protein TolC